MAYYGNYGEKGENKWERCRVRLESIQLQQSSTRGSLSSRAAHPPLLPSPCPAAGIRPPRVLPYPAGGASKDGNGSVSDRISAGFRSGGSGLGIISHPLFFGSGTKPIRFGFRFGFSPVDAQWIIVWNKNLYFILYLTITCLLRLFNLS